MIGNISLLCLHQATKRVPFSRLTSIISTAPAAAAPLAEGLLVVCGHASRAARLSAQKCCMRLTTAQTRGHAHLREVAGGHVVLGDRDREVQVQHRVPPAAWHPHRLPSTLRTGQGDASQLAQILYSELFIPFN
jgi:hypothetical protein